MTTTVFAGHYAVFTCGYSDSSFIPFWEMDNILVTSQTVEGVQFNHSTQGSVELSMVTFPVRLEHNGSVIRCGVLDVEIHPVRSDPVTLTIQGIIIYYYECLFTSFSQQSSTLKVGVKALCVCIHPHNYYTGVLSAVSNAEFVRSASSIVISWTAPFSLDVTGVDPDIWYSVLIHNVTDETAVSVPYPNCVNISETFCVFTPDHLSPCHKYNITVIPQNGAGVGESSFISIGTHTDSPSIPVVIRPSLAMPHSSFVRIESPSCDKEISTVIFTSLESSSQTSTSTVPPSPTVDITPSSPASVLPLVVGILVTLSCLIIVVTLVVILILIKKRGV